MGYDAYAYAVIGCKLPLAIFSETTRVRGCGHQEIEGAKFCAECGKPTWTKETKEPSADEIDENLSGKLKDMGIKAVWNGCESKSVYIGVAVGGYENASPIPVPDAERIREILVQAYGNEVKEFGLWAVLYESY